MNNFELMLRNGGEDAAKVLSKALDKDSTAIAALGSAPAYALALIANHTDMGLTLRGAADCLDLVVEQVEVGEVRALLEGNLTDDQRAELLGGRSDLFSSAVHLASIPDVIRAIGFDIGETFSETDPTGEGASLAVRAWAYKLKDREDFNEILNAEIGGRSVREHLLTNIYFEHIYGQPVTDELDEVDDPNGEPDSISVTVHDLSPSIFDDLGLDPDEDREVLLQLIEDNEFEDFDFEELQAARIERSNRHAAVETMEKTTNAAQSAASVADDLDDL